MLQRKRVGKKCTTNEETNLMRYLAGGSIKLGPNPVKTGTRGSRAAPRRVSRPRSPSLVSRW